MTDPLILELTSCGTFKIGYGEDMGRSALEKFLSHRCGTAVQFGYYLPLHNDGIVRQVEIYARRENGNYKTTTMIFAPCVRNGQLLPDVARTALTEIVRWIGKDLSEKVKIREDEI